MSVYRGPEKRAVVCRAECLSLFRSPDVLARAIDKQALEGYFDRCFLQPNEIVPRVVGIVYPDEQLAARRTEHSKILRRSVFIGYFCRLQLRPPIMLHGFEIRRDLEEAVWHFQRNIRKSLNHAPVGLDDSSHDYQVVQVTRRIQMDFLWVVFAHGFNLDARMSVNVERSTSSESNIRVEGQEPETQETGVSRLYPEWLHFVINFAPGVEPHRAFTDFADKDPMLTLFAKSAPFARNPC